MGVAAGVACAVAGVAALRTAWSRHGGACRIALGWALLACGVIGWRGCGAAWDKAVVLTILTPPLAALVVLAWSVERGRRLPRTPPIDVTKASASPQVTRFPWRGLTQFFLAGPVAGGAAVSLAGAVALRAPGGAADRLVTAGFVAPVAWALGGLWATTDGRLVRVGSGLMAVAAASFVWARL